MSPEFMDAPGEVIAPGALTAPKAREFADLLASRILPFVHLVECRRAGEREVVVVDVEPEVPQRPVHDIRRRERIAVRFDPADEHAPHPVALRPDFPSVAHTDLQPVGRPTSLCLFEEAYADQKLRWTAANFAKQLHRWLSRTARGELHEPDQPLERFFVGTLANLIIPADFYSAQAADLPERLAVIAAPDAGGKLTLIARRGSEDRPQRGVAFVGIVLDGEPRTHGAIRVQPTNLAELQEYLAEVGCDVLGALGARLDAWRYGAPELLALPLILIVRLPKRRAEESPPETIEVWAFATGKSLREVGAALGQWEIQGEYLLDMIGGSVEPDPASIRLDLLNPMPALTRDRAAQLNGLPGASDRKIVCIGAGALGSQVAMNLARAGYGRWTVADEDQFLPHNLARHYLDGFALGLPKAPALAHEMNSLYDEEGIASAVVANVLDAPGETVESAFREAEVVLDLSASVTVARHLAHEVESPGRRISVFLNPDGTDLVLLAEDADRTIRLDDLEMQYYREVVRRPELSHHLLRAGERLRYAHACRDVTSSIPQDLAALHAGIGARGARLASESKTATIAIWQAGPDLSVTALQATPVPYRRMSVGEWTLVVDPRLLDELFTIRAAKLPNETGGVLIGSFDRQRKIVYVVDTVLSPPDSQEWPTLYIRGHEGLEQRVQEVDRLTGGWLQYIGEWHSHPRGASCNPSTDDRKVFAWLTAYMAQDGLPPLMAIIGDGEQSGWFFGAM